MEAEQGTWEPYPCSVVLIPSSPHTVRDYGLIKATVGFNIPLTPPPIPPSPTPTNTWGTTWGVYHVAEQALYEENLTLMCILCGLDSHALTLN